MSKEKGIIIIADKGVKIKNATPILVLDKMYSENPSLLKLLCKGANINLPKQ